MFCSKISNNCFKGLLKLDGWRPVSDDINCFRQLKIILRSQTGHFVRKVCCAYLQTRCLYIIAPSSGSSFTLFNSVYNQYNQVHIYISMHFYPDRCFENKRLGADGSLMGTLLEGGMAGSWVPRPLPLPLPKSTDNFSCTLFLYSSLRSLFNVHRLRR